MHSKTKKFKYSRATEKQLYRKPDISRQKYFFNLKTPFTILWNSSHNMSNVKVGMDPSTWYQYNTQRCSTPTAQWKSTTIKKNPWDFFPTWIWVKSISVYVHSHSFPFPFSFPSWSLIPIPVGFPWNSHSHRHLKFKRWSGARSNGNRRKVTVFFRTHDQPDEKPGAQLILTGGLLTAKLVRVCLFHCDVQVLLGLSNNGCSWVNIHCRLWPIEKVTHLTYWPIACSSLHRALSFFWVSYCRSCWWRGTVVERRSLAGELSMCPALDLQLMGDH